MLDVRYVAGLFDGEGCISLVKQRRLNSPLPSYTIRVVIAMTHKPIILLLQDQFGGHVSQRKGQKEGHRNAFTLMWANRQAGTILQILIPHLILKRAEAEVALDFIQTLSQVGTSFWRGATPQEIQALQDKREVVRQRLASMKRVEFELSGMEANSEKTPSGE
jgi:hypothetical protein